jgi:hypothetical protein
MDEYIYVLFFIEDGAENIFYLGRTTSLKRRLSEHLNDKTGSKKSKFIQYLLKNDIEIYMKVLGPVTRQFDEDIALTNLLGSGHILVNSKNGDTAKPETNLLTMVTADQLVKGKWQKNPLFKNQTYIKVSGFTVIRFGRGVQFEVRGNGKRVDVKSNPVMGERHAFKLIADAANQMIE